MPENYFWDDLDSEIESLCRGAIDLMRDAGATIVPVRFETVDLLALARPATFAEAYLFHEPHLRDHLDQYGEDIRYRLLAGQYVLAHDYLRALRIRRLVMDEFNRVLAGVDLLATPAVVLPAFPIGAASVAVNGQDVALTGANAALSLIHNTFPFNQCGLPAISLPAGLTAAGLPAGLQLAAPAFADEKLLAVAAVVERLIGFDPTPPALKTAAPVA